MWHMLRLGHVHRRVLRHRPGRAAALFLAVLIAASGFTVLTASSSASRLDVVGTVNARARLNYDILVRPTGARTNVERQDSLIQGGYLSGVAGGISKKQWREIEQIPGIEVAAPIAMMGYVVPRVDIPIDVAGVKAARGDAVARLDVTWRYDNGLSSEGAVPDFAFLTDKHLALNPGKQEFSFLYGTKASKKLIGPFQTVERLGLSQSNRPSYMGDCSEDGSGSTTCGKTRSGVGPTITFPFPMLLAAIDPRSEAKLTGLGAQLESGSGLQKASLRNPHTPTGKVTPVLAAAVPATELQADVRVSHVRGGAEQKVLGGAGAPTMLRLPHTTGSTTTIDGIDAYRRLLKAFSTVRHHADPINGYFDPNALSQRFTIGTPHYQKQNGRLAPRTLKNNVTQRLTDHGFSGWAPAGMGDVAVRTASSLEGPEGRGALATPSTVQVVGTLPAEAASKLTDETSRILSGVSPTTTFGADGTSRHLLGEKPLAPSPNVPGLVQPPPLMITTLDATGQWYRNWGSADDARPISAIRVRVAGVTGVDETSRERVRLAAQRIQAQTGLEVDITLGASITDVQIENPPGDFGRPKLLLTQHWVKKAVATSILKAVDKKSLAIFALVLLVSALTVANAAVASVRARRAEFGVLACLGWTRGQIAGMVLGEITMLAALAGLISVFASLAIGDLVRTPIGLGRAFLAVPAALVIALIAGMIPVWQAGRSSPLDAIHAPVPTPKRAVTVRSLRALAMVNLARNKVRTGLGAAGLAVAVAAATFLVVITLGFRGAVVGTLLGNAIAVQVRGADYAAVAATLVLALLGVANVMYLNIRERGVEFATLSSLGWSVSNLNRVIVYEALGLGVLGTLGGVIVGLGTADIVFASTPVATLIVTTAVCSGAGIGIALVAAAGATHLMRRLPITAVLAEE